MRGRAARPRIAQRLVRLTRELARGCEELRFGAPVSHVYNPLLYARQAHYQYLRRWADSRKRVLFLGMNPGPWGMAQTGVPFGDVLSVRDWLGIEAPVRRPAVEHPARPVLGFACPRREVSGARLWGLFQERFEYPERFFQGHLVLNYCPLLFLRGTATRCGNFTPDKLKRAVAQPLYTLCDAFLARVVELLEPRYLVGIGGFAEQRLQRFAAPHRVVGRILHPSPANPAANRDFAGQAVRCLQRLGVWPA